MDREQKREYLDIIEKCKTDDDYFNLIEQNKDDSEFCLYAQCWWLCNKYQYTRNIEKTNKLETIVKKYNLDIDKIVEFSKTNLKHNDMDKHLANILKLDTRIKTEQNEKELLEYIGDELIQVVPVKNAHQYIGKLNKDKMQKAFNYKKEKFGYEIDSNNSFGYYFNVGKTDKNIEEKRIWISKRIIDNNLFETIKISRENISVGQGYFITKNDLPDNISKSKLINLDDEGIVKKGTIVKFRDIIVGCVRPKISDELSPEERLLQLIFKSEAKEFADESFYYIGECGTIEDVKVEKDKKKTKVEITISKEIKFGLGDYLGDLTGVKGKVCQILNEQEMIEQFGKDYDLVANFDIDNYIVRFEPLAEKSLKFFGEEKERYLNQKLIFSSSKTRGPIIFDKDWFKKFKNSDQLESIFNIGMASKICSEENTMLNQLTNKGIYELPVNDIKRINYIKNYLLALGVRIQLDNLNQVVRFSIISDEEKKEMSNGEVKKAQTINYRSRLPEINGLFDEKIFGTRKNYECRCGKYKRERYNGVVCDKCGVKVEKANGKYKYFGHIELVEEIEFLGIKTNVLLVIPTAMRDLDFIEHNNMSELNDYNKLLNINDYYLAIINRNNRVKKLEEVEVPNAVILNERRLLKEKVNEYYEKLIELIIKYLKEEITDNRCAYSTEGICVPSFQSNDGICLIPRKALVNIFRPYIIAKLRNSKSLLENRFKDEIWLQNEDKNIDSLFDFDDIKIEEKPSDDESTKMKAIDYNDLVNKQDEIVLNILPEVIKEHPNVIAFSRNEQGEVLNMKIGITDSNCIIVSENDYKKLCLDDTNLVDVCLKLIDKESDDEFSINMDNNEEDLISDIVFKEIDTKNVRYELEELIKQGKELTIKSAVGQYILRVICN